MSLKVPMSGPDITADEVAAVNEVLSSGRLSMGPKTVAFEQAIADYVGARNAVAVSSGTAALHIGLVAAGVKRGDLVITSPFSFVASANVVLYQDAVPIFVDVDAESLNLDSQRVLDAVVDLSRGGSRAATWMPPRMPFELSHDVPGRLSAVIPVHVFGQPADIGPILDIAGSANLAVIEDACEAIGAAYNGVRVGAGPSRVTGKEIRHAACFGFYPNKQMTTGEGGIIVTDSDEWAGLFRSLRNQGRDVFDAWLEHSRLGFNYRIDEMSSALGLVQTRRLEELLACRQHVADLYSKGLEGIDGVRSLPVMATTTRRSWFVYVVRLDDGFDRDKLIMRLEAQGIPTRPYFRPIHLQPYYRDMFGLTEGMFPNAEAAGRELLALPFFGTMTAEQVETVCHYLEQEVDRI